jgi:hypothetical protein
VWLGNSIMNWKKKQRNVHQQSRPSVTKVTNNTKGYKVKKKSEHSRIGSCSLESVQVLNNGVCTNENHTRHYSACDIKQDDNMRSEAKPKTEASFEGPYDAPL